MRPLESLLSIANLLVFVVSAVPRLRATLVGRFAVFIALLMGGAQALLEGPRWQLFPAYTMSGAFFLGWLRRRGKLAGTASERSGIKLLAALLGIVSGALGLAVSIALPFLLPVFRLPRPTGRYPIGTLTYHWVDDSRSEIFSDDPNDRRELMVQIWYPARGNSASPRASYVEDPDIFAALLHMLHLPGFFFDQFRYVQTHTMPSAPVAEDAPSYPVLLFASGRGGFRQESTHLFEELVSHGYIVAAIDQPYAATGVVFPDGRLVTIDPRLLPGPTGGIPADLNFFNEVVIPYLTQDILFTLNRLTVMNQSDPNAILTGRIDLKRVGVFGPSLGGHIGVEACFLDPRLRACLAMDVHMPADVVREGLAQPVMIISRDAEWMQLEGWSQTDIDLTQTTMRSVYEKLRGDGYFVRIAGMFHNNFSDAPLYSPLMSVLGLTGPINAHRSASILAAYTLAFFDKHLKGLPVPLLDNSPAPYPEVVYEMRHPGG